MNRKWIVLFGYPIDNSIRSLFVNSKEDVADLMVNDKYKDIRYFICAFPVEEGFVNND